MLNVVRILPQIFIFVAKFENRASFYHYIIVRDRHMQKDNN